MRLLLAAALLLAACGGGGGDDEVAPDAGSPDSGPVVPGDLDGDEWPEEIDNCPGIFNPEQRDRDADGVGDDCDSCPATPNGATQSACDPVSEQEPNDGPGQALPLPEPGRIREVRGSIEAPAPDQAFDRFQIMVPARTLLHVRAARARAESLLEPIVMVSGGGYTTPRIAHGLFSAARQIYVAEAGTYEIAISDRRGVLMDDPRGAESYAYALAIELLEAAPETVNAPATRRPFILSPPGSIGLYQTTVDPSDVVRIAAESDGLDTILIVERADGTVIENDDIGPNFIDSRVLLSLAERETLRIAIDHQRVDETADLEVRLTIDSPPRNAELEPNDAVGLASSLVFPGETTGRINAPPAPNRPDVDWYRFEGRAGQIIALTGLIPAGSQVDPTFSLARLADEAGSELRPLYTNHDSSGLAPRIEAILYEPGTYVLEVADQRNFGAPPFVGSDDADFTRYLIFSEPVGLQPEAVVLTESGSVSATLATGGRLARHLVITSEPTVVVARTVGTTSVEVVPFLRIYGPNATGLLGEGARDATAYLAGPESYVLAVHNGNDGRGDASYGYELFVRYLPAAAAVGESEPNDDRTSADPMNAGLPSVVEGTLAPGDGDFFRTSFGAGTRVTIELSAGRDGKNLALYDASGAFIRGGAGRIQLVPNPGDHFIEVTGTPGPYTLIVR